MLEVSTSEATDNSSSPQMTTEMCGQGIVIRSTAAIDEGYTVELAGAPTAR